MEKKYFIGYSTIGNRTTRNWTLYDLDLIKRDLLNHFQTRVGERLMRPTFGCEIWNYIHEPLTPDIVSLIENEVTRIVNLDARTEVRKIRVQTYEHGVVVLTDLFYRPFDMVDRFRIEFDARQ